MNGKRHPAWSGVLFGLAAYGMWGFFPLFFRQLASVSPPDILCNRAFWCFLFVGGLLFWKRDWGSVRAAFRQPRQMLALTLAAWLVGSNWLIFLYALEQQQVVASSLGYFLTPLLNVLLGLLFLRERLSWHAWVAVFLAVLALGNEIMILGQLPWISLALAGTFGLYGLVRKQVNIGAMPGLWLETLAMLPPVFLYASWQAGQGHAVLHGHSWDVSLLLALAGVLTALPLMAFAAAARRLDLATVGMLMYINPSLQFATAIWVFGEPLHVARLFSFALIWIGLAIFAWGAWQRRPHAA